MRWDGRLRDRWERLQSASHPITFISLASPFSPLHVFCSDSSTGVCSGRRTWDHYWHANSLANTHTHTRSGSLRSTPPLRFPPSEASHTFKLRAATARGKVFREVCLQIFAFLILSQAAQPRSHSISHDSFHFLLLSPYTFMGSFKISAVFFCLVFFSFF